MDEQLYLFKITLADIEPKIWRRFLVPPTIPLDRLHEVIQIVMGWTDRHLYEFSIGNKKYTEYPESREDGLKSGKFRLGDLIKQKGYTFGYLYDFGDSWQHDLIFENDRYASPDPRHEVHCIDGARACPPEDVGGIMGYNEFCKILRNPDREDYESSWEWVSADYEIEKFDIYEINGALAKYLHWSRDRDLKWQG